MLGERDKNSELKDVDLRKVFFEFFKKHNISSKLLSERLRDRGFDVNQKQVAEFFGEQKGEIDGIIAEILDIIYEMPPPQKSSHDFSTPDGYRQYFEDSGIGGSVRAQFWIDVISGKISDDVDKKIKAMERISGLCGESLKASPTKQNVLPRIIEDDESGEDLPELDKILGEQLPDDRHTEELETGTEV